MQKSDLLYLEHILENLSKAVAYLHEVSYDEFVNDEEKQDAVIRKIEVSGEATKRVSKDIRAKYSHLPWRAIAGMRDKLIHDYFEVDIDLVWETATRDIPELIPEIKKVVKELSH